MARGLKRSLLKETETSTPAAKEPADFARSVESGAPDALPKASGGVGSAWKAGALAKSQDDLDQAREEAVEAILAGDQVIEIDPTLIEDPIGTDRRSDWMEQEGFLALVDSIRENGQDMPILVWPKDPDWRPDRLDPRNLERVQFLLLAGRRRSAAAEKLGKPVRAVIASQAGRGTAEDTFNMLVLRFRENEEREDLSAFERLVSIGQMYEELAAASRARITAKEFASRIGVHESVVSRARSVFKARDDILNAFKNVYELSFRDIQTALAELGTPGTSRSPTREPPRKTRVVTKVGTRKLAVESVNEKLSIKTSGFNLNKRQLSELGKLVADYLTNNRPDDEAGGRR
ncbi:MAG: ParB N-terminal domain-containing protein [Rhizobiaceae bacterium]|nr:ParB N-terminal domain-containing protein [Rhizobiaceae bacterium]